jgi:hypothetical protein
MITAFPAATGAAGVPTAAPVGAVATVAPPKVVVDASQIQGVAGMEAAAAFAAGVPKLVGDGYPMIVRVLGAQPATPPKQVTVVFDKGMDGVAATGGDEIHVAARYVEGHPDDTGMIIHELTHVVQAYPKYDPVWLVEGIADYVRFYHYEPAAKRPHPNPATATYHDSYRTTAAFLDWAVRTYDPDLVKKLDAALKAGNYSEDVFVRSTGKGLDKLNAEWIFSLKA